MRAAILLAALLLASTAHAQDGLALARVCVSERGWAHDTDDCAAIASVARGRAARTETTFAAALAALAPRLHAGTVSRRWLAYLAGPERPMHWPRSASWERRRADWTRTLEHAEAIVRGEVPDPCAEVPVSWGSRADVAAGRRRGSRWVSVACGRTRNLFGRWL